MNTETTYTQNRRRRPRTTTAMKSPSTAMSLGPVALLLLLAAATTTMTKFSQAFTVPSSSGGNSVSLSPPSTTFLQQQSQRPYSSSSFSSPTALHVWWFGGTQEGNDDDDSCELVAVRIERTSPNSRKISGEIVVPAPLERVWSILTDYDRLAVHVPNLMESKVVRQNNGPRSTARPGDGSYRCRLFQKGAQKIIGFDFSASVTMDMTEQIVGPVPPDRQQSQQQSKPRPLERKIGFKCVDSQFFSEFDGDWTVKEQVNPATGQIETLCSYVVDVRPKGPVPVAALEWRIREDVPTNLRAVKAATLLAAGVVPLAASSMTAASSYAATTIDSAAAAMGKAVRRVANATTNGRAGTNAAGGMASLSPIPVLNDWEKDETMAKYL